MNDDPSKRRLGRGLAALIGEMDQPMSEMAGRSSISADRKVAIDLVVRNPRNPRKHFAEDDLQEAGSNVSLEAPDAVVGVWDPARLDQVVTNLLSNAIKYGLGRPIDVTLISDGTTARLTVRDRGIGISPDERGRIFGRFERAVSDRHYGGFGLGLWIVRQIVEASGGVVRFESEPEHGTTFVVELPLSPPR